MKKEVINMKLEIATMKQQLKDTIQAVGDLAKENKEQHQEIKDCIDEFIKAAESKFAPRWVADFLKGFIIICVLAVIYYLFNHVGLPTP